MVSGDSLGHHSDWEERDTPGSLPEIRDYSIKKGPDIRAFFPSSKI
jgi:hypothetical protein